MSSRSILAVAFLASSSLGCGSQDADRGFSSGLEPTEGDASATAPELPTSVSVSASATAEGSTSDSGAPDQSTSSDAGSSDESTTTGADTTGGTPIYDVGAGSSGGPVECDDPDDPACACTAVDILFVIDSSGSMGDEQVALGEAFPQFVDAIVEELPAGTSVHIGVTTTEMSPGGAYAITFPCNGEKPQWYLTPEEMNSGVNGAQGRLMVAGNGPAYWEFSTNAPAADLQAVSEWFVDAAQVGTNGSSEEMPLAGAGWALHPINEPTNAGFIRDEGAALIIFFVTDEDDQTPIAGGEAQGLIDTIAAAKTECGGLACVAAGGTVRESCLDQDALGMFFGSLDPTSVHTQPIEYNTMATSDLFVEALRDSLAQIIAGLCWSLPPEG